MKPCTFTPVTNPVEAVNPTLAQMLRVPVYERLVNIKPIPEEILRQQRESREMEGVTFQPNLEKSQKTYKKKFDKSNMPSENVISEAVDRLYDTHQKYQKNLKEKQAARRMDEVEGCTFVPNVLSPTRDKKKFLESGLTRSVERLYEENGRRYRDLLKKEVATRQQELEDCTFQPNREAKNFKPKSKDERFREDIPAHDRLYGRFKKQQEEKQTQRSQDSKRLTRSFSTDDKGSIVRKKRTNENFEVNTPAFDRLYKDMVKRKLKLSELKEKVGKEEGCTFQPETNWSKKRDRSRSGSKSFHSYRMSSPKQEPSKYEVNPQMNQNTDPEEKFQVENEEVKQE